jgi:hypothetical protein
VPHIYLRITLACLFLLVVGAADTNANLMPFDDYPVGSSPEAVCGADFNGDGDNDLAVMNHWGRTVSVFINLGDGSFGTATTYNAGSSMDIIAGNFTGGPAIDLALACNFPDVLLIMEGNGDGTFQDTVRYEPGGMTEPDGSYALSSGDFNNDTYIDIAIAYKTTNNAGIFINDHDTSFIWYGSHSTGSFAQDIFAGDLNGDNFDDVVVSNILGHSLSVLISLGTGGFDPAVNYTTSSQPYALDCDDLDGDGAIDMVSSFGGTYGGYDVFMGNGDGTFGTALETDSVGYLTHMCLADVDGASGVDLIVLQPVGDTVDVLLNDGSGNFSAPVGYDACLTAGFAQFVLPIELNGDSDDDLVIIDNVSNSIRVIFNNGFGGFPTAVGDDNDDVLPANFELSQNYPNPFNPETTIKYSLSRKSYVTVDVFNALGQNIRTLLNREVLAGSHAVTWDGTDGDGNQMATGIYLYRFKVGEQIQTSKMLLLK